MKTGKAPAKRDVASFVSPGTCNTHKNIRLVSLVGRINHGNHGDDEMDMDELVRQSEFAAKERAKVMPLPADRQTVRWRLSMTITAVRPVRTGEDEPLGHPDNPADVQARADIRKKSREASKEDGERVASDAADRMISRWRGRAETIECPPAAKRRLLEVIPATPLDEMDMDELFRQSVVTARHSRAKNTRQSYKSAQRTFAKFAAKHGQTAFPAAPRTVAAFLQSKIYEEAAARSLNVYLSAIRSAHLEKGMPDPTDDPHVRAVAHAYSRIQAKQGRRPKQAYGLSEADLAAIVAFADKDNDIFAIRDTAIISVTCEALMRRSECGALRVSDFWLKSNSDGDGCILIRYSKTDKKGDGHTRYLGKQAAGRVVRWLAAAPASPDDPLFRRIRRGGHVQSNGNGLTGKSINNIMQSRGKAAGIAGLSGHSGRVGMAQTLVANGASLPAVMNAGGWATPKMVAHYTSGAEAANGAVAALRRKQAKSRR